MTGKASQSLKIKFKRSSKKVWDLSERPSNNQLLELYALFKQATDGDCQGRASGESEKGQNGRHGTLFQECLNPRPWKDIAP